MRLKTICLFIFACTLLDGCEKRQPETSNHPIVEPQQSVAGERLGMTWGVFKNFQLAGYSSVGCHGEPVPVCNAYRGDTSCSSKLPVLCTDRSEQLREPRDMPHTGYHWSGKEIKLSQKIVGAEMHSLEDANNVCRREFGSQWAIAEFHDVGSGWGLVGKGEISNRERFWVHINDQSANCW